MKKGKKILSILLMITIIFTLVGCEKKSKGTKGRYTEEEINAPEDLAYAMDFRKCDDGTLVLVGTSQNGDFLYYQSKDSGESWEKSDIDLPKKDNYITQVNNSKVSKDKEIFISYCFYNEEEMNKSEETNDQGTTVPDNNYIIVDANKNIKEVQLDCLNEKGEEGYPEYYTFLFEENIIAMDSKSRILEIDKDTGKIEKDFSVDGSQFISNGVIVDNSLLVVTDSKVKKYDLSNDAKGKDVKTLEKKKLFNANLAMFQGKDKGILYYATKKGLFKYDEGKDKVSKVIDSSLCSTGNSDKELRGLVEIEEGVYIGCYCDFSGAPYTSLVKYVYSSNAKNPDEEITVYSLYSEESIENAIDKYQKGNTNVKINYKAAIDEEESEKASEKLKTLNTEIMAGNGPDVLILDGLPAEKYVEEGLLEDISDVIKSYSDKGEIVESIEKAYNDGEKIYQFPMYFKIPVIVGEKDAIKDVEDMSSLLSAVEKMDKNQMIMNRYSVVSAATLLQPITENNILDKKGINKENLKKYFENSKKLYDICSVGDKAEKMETGDKDIEDTIGDYLDEATIMSTFRYSDTYASSMLFSDAEKLSIGSLTNVNGLSDIFSMQSVKKDFGYKFINKNNIFIPTDTIGLSAGSKNKKIAKDFIKALFSKETQEKTNYGMESGFPVNKSALEKSKEKSNNSDDGEMCIGNGEEEIKYKQVWPSEKDLKDLDNEIEKLEKPAEINSKLLLSINIANYKYCGNKISLDEAVKYVVDNTDLDLAE